MGEIRYRYDYLRSAVHEVAHWLVAGPERRRQDDFGYWYSPDDRSAEQQLLFFQTEIAPQALEWILCDAIGLPFEVSLDNLNPVVSTSESFLRQAAEFKSAVEKRRTDYVHLGLPARAKLLVSALKQV